ncbi:hypothetical protein AGLY_018180 [Aphis glycines]|uniref:Transposable element P transposase-like RNase H domain-containing protein n=1 Tax=Aphis glycines TaxID=307491 RepID=A0A6G0SST2_APHGL|nr:hypothetical protein AGLY_018180 [Aphis glycines]
MAKFKECLKAAEKFSDKYLDSKIIGCMTSAAAIFIKLQLRETKNSPKGRRFTLEEKLLCLSLYTQSTKSYQLLSKLFILLARKTLSTLLSQISISTGLDKMSLEPQLQYDDNVGCIVGFEDNGLDRTQRFADHNLVFMIKGITNNFKQPISYTFCESSTKRYDLANQITNVLKAVHLSGLKVVDTICDQERIKVVHLYDSPHLLKGIRNNLLSKNLMFTINGHQREACWKDIVGLYVLDTKNIMNQKVVDGKIFRTAVKPNSPHHQLWRGSLKVLDTMYFVNPVSKERSKPQPPTLKNWVKTIKGLPKSNCEEDLGTTSLAQYQTLFKIFTDNQNYQDEEEGRHWSAQIGKRMYDK